MFGINLWARPFLHPAAAGTPGSTPGLEGLAHLPRHPGLGSHPYMIPGLGDKNTGLPMPPNSLFLYRPGEHLLHPSMLRLDQGSLSSHHTSPGGERTSLHPNLHHDDEYPSAFVPAKRARLDGYPGSDKTAEDLKMPSKSPMADGRSGGSPPMETRCPSTGGRSLNNGGLSPGLSVRSPESLDAANTDEKHSYTDHHSPSPIDIAHPRCPVCGLNLQIGEIESHYIMEMEKLRDMARLSAQIEVKEIGHRGSPYEHCLPTSSAAATASHTVVTVSGSRYETFVKIKGNRQARLNAKYKIRRPKRPSDQGALSGEDGQRDGDHNSSFGSDHRAILLDDGHHDGDDRDQEIDVTTPDPVMCNSAMDLSRSNGQTDNNNKCDSKADQLRCHVCLGTYNKPVTSIQCWHVHCEECWLKIISTKRLCPQCNMITSPADLRKVFI